MLRLAARSMKLAPNGREILDPDSLGHVGWLNLDTVPVPMPVPGRGWHWTG